uniref:Atp9 n=1 Tax=Neorotalia gaimardi TaxID=2855197 RepID=UPI0023F156DC|nr:Atp9 [Neorotalia gaimardi]WEF49969.1 Atp9 [Neorotalia gaimardi]
MIILSIPIILLGFRYLASSIPLISLAGVAIGAGLILSILIFAICRNPIISNVLIRWALIGSSLVEVSGSIGSVYSFLIPYAFPLYLLFLMHFLYILIYFNSTSSSLYSLVIYY